MADQNCIFCQLASKKIPTDFLYEDDEVVAFYDHKPQAKVHFLVVSKKHLVSLAVADLQDTLLLGKCLQVCKIVAQKLGLAENGYKVITNIGKFGGQMVPHLHLHVLGGEQIKSRV